MEIHHSNSARIVGRSSAHHIRAIYVHSLATLVSIAGAYHVFSSNA